MAKGYLVNGAKLQEIMKSMDYGTSPEEIERFCSDVAKVSPQSLKRWLSNGGIHRDTLETLAEKLPVSSWKELRLDFPITQAPESAPFSITIHVHDENARYKKIVEAISRLLIALDIKVAIYVTKVKRGSLIITIAVDHESLKGIMSLFNKGQLRRLRIRQIDLSSSAVTYLTHLLAPRTEATEMIRLRKIYRDLRFRRLSNRSVHARRKPQQKPERDPLHV